MTPSSQHSGGFLRLFVAVELPEDWRGLMRDLQGEQERTAPGYFRWVKPELLHVTVVFLGRQSAASFDQIVAVVGRASGAARSFRMTLGGLGTFGPAGAPRVLWVEVQQPDGRLQQLRRALERELRAANVIFDEKPLMPHITLARAKPGGRGPPRILDRSLLAPLHSVERIALIESKLSPRGPSYVVRAVASLAEK